MTDDRSSRGTLAGLALMIGGTAAIGVAYAATIVLRAPPPWAPWLLATGASATPVGLFVLGAATRRVLSPGVAIVLAGLFGLLFASFAAALALPPEEGAGGRLLLGLPFRLAIVFYGVGIVPLVALPVVFGLTFGERSRVPNGPA